MPESKSERFRRVAPGRVDCVVRWIRLLGRCADRKAYGYMEHESEAVIEAIRHEVSKLEAAFKERAKFELPETAFQQEELSLPPGVLIPAEEPKVEP